MATSFARSFPSVDHLPLHFLQMNRVGCCFTVTLALLSAACRPERRGHEQSVDLVIQDVAIVDVERGRVSAPSTVVVRGGRITALGQSGDVKPEAGAVVIDGRGRFLIPGLWDMHSHSLWDMDAMPQFLKQYTIAGVTGIRDMGGRLDVLRAYRTTMNAGRSPWPRIVAAGVVLDGVPPIQPDISIAVPDAAAAALAVDSLASAGVDFIKVYTTLPPHAYSATLTAARRHDLPVVGHLPNGILPETAAQGGQRSIEHLREEIEPFCLGEDESVCAQLAALFRESEVWQVPTLVALRPKAHFSNPGDTLDARLRLLPEALVKEWRASRRARLRRPATDLPALEARYRHLEWLTRFFGRNGVPLLVGSDAGNPFVYPGTGVHDEMELMVRAGLTPREVLFAATLGPARFLHAQDSLGTIEVGRVADLVMLRGNPLEEISAVRLVEGVMLRGRWLNREALDAIRNTLPMGNSGNDQSMSHDGGAQ